MGGGTGGWGFMERGPIFCEGVMGGDERGIFTKLKYGKRQKWVKNGMVLISIFMPSMKN